MEDNPRPVVTALRPVGRTSAAITVDLDGHPWRRLPRPVVEALGLAVGETVDPAAVDEALARDALIAARNRALRLLAFRDRSFREMCDRLAADGYGRDGAHAVAVSLRETGLIDDARMATVIARTLRDARGYGSVRIRRELSRRGIDDADIEHALSLSADCSEEDRAAAHAARLAARGRSAASIAAALARRGFETGVAYRAARDATVADGDGPPDDVGPQ